ncbi:MAG: CPBP family intramembrane metalloprotease [Burkholderiaceae bacterium]|nr:CPBP family intramembrane metalloprotease [Burkholderiaceae bacterium]
MAYQEGLPPTGWTRTLLLFGVAGGLLYLVTHALIPTLFSRTGWQPILLWFLLGGLGIFLPLILFGIGLVRREPLSEGRRSWAHRLRFRRMSGADWRWTLGGLVLVATLSAAVQGALTIGLGEVNLHPPFMQFEPLGPGRYWILAAWLPFWLLNILGEEFLWRGVLLPRQEIALGQHAWLANAVGWSLFHLAFGWQLLMLLSPILFILPYVAQRTQNTWPAVIMHAGLNGPGFVAVAFGYV